MIKLHRHRTSKTGEKIEFKFSHLRVSKIPRGWDKLVISLIAVGSGKTLVKSSKAWTSHGGCHWPDVFSEFRSLPPKEQDDYIFKFVVSMDSARAILGEATLNLKDQITPRDAVPVSLPLTAYSEGPILLMNVECITPRTKLSDGIQWRERTNRHAGKKFHADEADQRSDESDIIQGESITSSSGNRLPSSPLRDEFRNKDVNRSEPGSHRSSDSGDSFMGRGRHSRMNSFNGSQSSSTSAPTEETSKGAGPNRWQDRNGDPSKVLLEAAQETIEELRGEARLWERKARKQLAELEALKKENKEQARQRQDADKRLREADEEIERLRSSKEGLHLEEQILRQRELEQELRFLKETNASLSMQLKKTQESNIELVSILQELEENVEQQKQDADVEDLKREMFDLKAKIQELERECAELTEENLGLVIKMKDAKTGEASIECTAEIFLGKFSSTDPGSEIFQHMAKDLGITKIELEKKCTDLELELQKFKDAASVLATDLCKSQNELQKKSLEFSDLRKTLMRNQLENNGSADYKLLEYLATALVDANILSLCIEDFENSKHELEFQARELEQQNMSLLQCSRLEVENSKNQVIQLKEEIQKMAADKEKEIEELKEDKLKLENSLREAQSEIKSYETQMESVKQELGSNIQSLIGLLNASKESEDMLLADIGRMKRQMEKMKSGEENIKKLADELQLKIETSDTENKQLTEEISDLKAQLMKITELQDEIIASKSCLEEAKLEKEKLEKSIEMISEERDKLNLEKNSVMEKMLEMEARIEEIEKRPAENGNTEELLRTIASLRTELSEALETNTACNEQIKGLLAQKEIKTSSTTQSLPGAARTDRLEIELKEMREQYLQMSLRYAEVEAEREELVMKLKSTKNQSKWFS